MKVLFLGYLNSPLVPFIAAHGDDVVASDEKIDVEKVRKLGVDFIVSFGYKHILKPDLIDHLPKKIINLHVSYLPWNRGADPNFWSFIDGSPKGVSIHYIAEGIDTGDVLAQRRCLFEKADTLKTSYEKLQREMISLFEETWDDIRTGRRSARPQTEKGSFHLAKEKEKLAFLTADLGFNTPVAVLESYGAKSRS